MKQIQSLIPVTKFVKNYLKRNPNAQLKTIFKNVRNIETVSFIGDWPLLVEIIQVCASKNIFFEKSDILKTTKISTDPLLKNQRIDSKLVAILSNRDELKAKISAD